MEEVIKNILAGIGMVSVIGLGAIHILDLYGDENNMASCADKFQTIEFKKLDGNIYCQTADKKWRKLPEANS